MKNMYRMHMSRLFSRKETHFVISVLMVILASAFAEQCFYVYGWPVTHLNSAAVGWILNMDQQPGSGTVVHILIYFLFGILSAIPYGDSLYADQTNRLLAALTIRTKGHTYFYSGALAAFTGSFVIFMGFFLLVQLLALIVFPVQSTFYDYYGACAWEDCLSRTYLFPALFFQKPYLHNLVFMLYDSLWAGIFALTAYTTSLFVHKRLAVLAIPQIILILGSLGLFGSKYQLTRYLYPSPFMEKSSLVFYGVCPIAVGVVLIALFYYGINKRRELYI